MTLRWGLVGFGEAGRVIGGVLAGAGADLAVHDRALLDPARGPGLAEAISAIGAVPVADVAQLADRDVVLSLVTPATALAAAVGFAPHARDGVLYLDLNSTAPTDKRAMAAALTGARVVDGVMTGGGIQLDGARIPISLAGPDAAEAAQVLTGAGLTAAVVGAEIGAAAALKMLRSVVVKGMEGLWVEALLAARELDVVEPLMAMIEETLDRWSTRDFATMLVTTHVAHAGRRSAEVAMARDTVAGTGVPPLLTSGLLARHQLSARGLAAAGHEPGAVPPTLAAALEALRSLPADGTG
ncbi:3-hydroxyisobutyrate dehydrogenase [Modestobacter sp. DSM 44400]|uniref:NAD(P)-dependent oxidoreductase n=1 Tax=Modestobacter sp. DSM 44400 TaxID=1550230 RepID=UPI000896123E|nr:NAD(P)-dependent oxidoreductase [Modestobacter sp. DSM 44400]SDX75233.1 3-hydroxyisobutyrate dehydrogenase [Modestobacter sp. DSM 44400]